MSTMDDDEFGLSSSDEAELLSLQPAIITSGKRKNENDEPLGGTKKPRTYRNDAPSSSPAAIATANRVLKQQFGMDAFRLKQEAAITRLLDGGSSVVVFPTGWFVHHTLTSDTDDLLGGGKSLCYQVPALCFKEIDKMAGERQGTAEQGITLVVSPLIALMKDQVDALQRRGIAAAVLDSTRTKEQYVRLKVRRHKALVCFKVLYISRTIVFHRTQGHLLAGCTERVCVRERNLRHTRNFSPTPAP